MSPLQKPKTIKAYTSIHIYTHIYTSRSLLPNTPKHKTHTYMYICI